MSKNIFKEIIIVLLLTLAIILILGVLLYEYVPMNKRIPDKISYTTPENIKEELQSGSEIDDSEIVLTHQIDATELSNYKDIQEYVPGKKNPFGEVVVDESTNDEQGTEKLQNGETSQGTGDTQTPGTSQNPSSPSGTGGSGKEAESSGTSYLPDKGTK